MRNYKKLYTVLMLVSFILAAVSPAMAAGIAKVEDLTVSAAEGAATGTGVKNASTIYFGSFWQGANVSAGKSAIAWKVLQTDAANTKKEDTSDPSGYTSATGITLLTEKVMYAHYFNPNTNSWGSSAIRTTLNSPAVSATNPTAANYGGFLGDAFSTTEQGYILTTANETLPYGGTGTPEKTNDKLFLLSYEEAKNGGTMGFTGDADRKANATAFATSKVAYGNSETYNEGKSYDPADWWLRSPGNLNNYVYSVGSNGYVYSVDNVDDDNSAARSALNLDKQSVIFLSAAETKGAGGKSAVAAGNGFTLTGDGDTSGYKLTLLDETITAPTGVSVTQEEISADEAFKSIADTATTQPIGSRVMDLTNGYKGSWSNPKITYSGVAKGTNVYVSAILEDATEGRATKGQYVQYAKISTEASETDKEVAIDKKDGSGKDYLADGTYTMRVFTEKVAAVADGAHDTAEDYASKFGTAADGTKTDFTIHKGGEDKNEGVLAAEYADKGLTANLGNGFKLGFESAKYDTKVNVGTGNGEVFGGTTIAELKADTGNTTVTGFVNAEKATIESGKQITTNGAFVSDKFVAIGKGAVVNSAATNSVALGSGSVADEANTISVGSSTQTRSISNVTAVTPASGGTYAATTGQVYNAMLSSVTLGADSKTLTVAENGTTKDVDLSALKTTQGNTLESYFTSGVANCATKDASGNVIADTYATKTALGELNSTVIGHTTEIGNLQTAVAAKANADEVYTKTETYNKTQIDRMIGSGGKLGVAYTDDTFAEIKLAGTEGTKISNLKAGEISETSTEAVNGAQLYETNANITANKKAIEAINDSAVMKSGITAVKVAKYDGYETAIANKADKATTLEGYGITDAYTKTNVDDKVMTLNNRIDNIEVSGSEAIGAKKITGKENNPASARAEGSISEAYNSGVSKNSTAGIAIGYGATVGYENGEITTDPSKDTTAEKSIAIGHGSTVTGANSIAVGTGHTVSGNNSGAFGDPNIISGNESYAVGNNNEIDGNNNFVLGNNVKIARTVENSVALGHNSTVTESNVVSVGSAENQRRIVNVADGINPTDAVNMRQLDSVSGEVKEVGAISAALAGLHYAEPSGEEGDKLSAAAAYGGYRGENAAAVGVAFKPNPNFMLSASTSIGNSQNAYNAGISYKFGKGETAQTRAALQKQVKYLNSKIETLESGNAALKNKVEEQDAKISRLENDAEVREMLVILMKKLIKQLPDK